MVDKTEEVLKQIELDFLDKFKNSFYLIECIEYTNDYFFKVDKKTAYTDSFLKWLSKINEMLFKENINNIRIVILKDEEVSGNDIV